MVEYCQLGSDSVVGDNCVLSCTLLPDGVEVPSSLFVHTVCLAGGFATMLLGCGESFKDKSSRLDAAEALTYCDVPLGQALERMGRSIDDLWEVRAVLQAGQHVIAQAGPFHSPSPRLPASP